MSISRRSFIKRSAVKSVGIASIPMILSSCVDEKVESKTGLTENDVVLFQGDSITDAGREKKHQIPNSSSSFGGGYALLAASSLLNEFAANNLTIYNRGISGNKVYQLSDRWQEDCIGLKPNVLSILIGVNDFWHMKNGNYDGDVKVYEEDYRKLLKRTKKALPDIKFVICEPFLVEGGTAVKEGWIEEFKAYQAVSKKMSEEFNTLFVPFQKIFDEASKVAPGPYWAADGVHPSMAGAELMAKSWLKVMS